MVDVKTEIVIEAQRALVAEYAANPDNAPEWYVNIISATWQTARPLQVGSIILFTARFMGKALQYTYEIVKYEREKTLVMRTIEGPFPMETTYRWEKVNEHQTRMTLRNAGEPKGFSKMVAPFLAWAMRRANRKDLEKLKGIMESA